MTQNVQAVVGRARQESGVSGRKPGLRLGGGFSGHGDTWGQRVAGGGRVAPSAWPCCPRGTAGGRSREQGCRGAAALALPQPLWQWGSGGEVGTSQSLAVRPLASLGMSAVVMVSRPVALSPLEWEEPALGASGLSPTPVLPESE